MKPNLLHVCFILDESASMFALVKKVSTSFDTLMKRYSQAKEIECIVSLYRFATKVQKEYVGTPITEVPVLNYNPSGLTVMYDGIGRAVDEIGQWLNNMDESERPSKNLIVIITDGAENHSKDYSFQKIKDMIKHQEEKYNWSFIWIGTDISSLDDIDKLGITLRKRIKL